MTAPGIAIALFVLLVLGGGIIAYLHTASVASLIAGGTPGFGLLVGGLGVLKRKEFWLVFAPFLTLLLTVLLAGHLAVSREFMPTGLMGIFGLVALVLFYRALPSKETL